MTTDIETPEGLMREPAAGDKLGRYELLLPVARGGMGRVWAARLNGARGFRRLVAVKTVTATLDRRSEQMLLQEANVASQIQHPNVVQTIELGEQDGTVYLVMELIVGEPLSALFRDSGPEGMPVSLAVNIIGQLLRGLHAAHELRDASGELVGLVHRDVSPQNVMVTASGEVKILDFGIAKMAGDSDLTHTGEIKGKISYLAPEQLRGGAVDRRADVFAAGIIMYMAMLGRHPFKGDNDPQTLSNLFGDRPAAFPSTIVEDFPTAIEEVLMWALEKDQDKRCPSAESMLTALEIACPEAFTPETDTELREYLGRVLGPRMEHRRLILRRAESLAEVSSGTHSAITPGPTARDVTPTTPSTPRKGRRFSAYLMGAVAAATTAAASYGVFNHAAFWRGLNPSVAVPAARVAAPPVETTSAPPVETSHLLPESTPVETHATLGAPAAVPIAPAARARPAPKDKPQRPSTPYSPSGYEEQPLEEEVLPAEPPPVHSAESVSVVAPSTPVVAPVAPAVVVPVRSNSVRNIPPKMGGSLLAINPGTTPYKPRVPEVLLRTSESFSTGLRVCVSASGAVSSVNVTQSSPADPAIVSAVSGWRYKPLIEGGIAVPFCYSFMFKIMGSR